MIRVGISACLLGQAVRYDGGHKRDATLRDTLGPHVTWVPVCPEVELGLGVPRPPTHLAGDASAPRLVVTATGEDFTERLDAWAARRLAELRALDLHGYVFKSGSPSCGLLAGGLFAAAFARPFPTSRWRMRPISPIPASAQRFWPAPGPSPAVDCGATPHERWSWHVRRP